MKASHFDGLITTLLGYILLAGALTACHVSLGGLACVRIPAVWLWWCQCITGLWPSPPDRMLVLAPCCWFLTGCSAGFGIVSEVSALQAPLGCLLHCCQGKIMLDVVRVSNQWYFKMQFYLKKWKQTMATSTESLFFSVWMQVSLLVVMEIGLFPLICGWWLDICSLVSSDTNCSDWTVKLCSHHFR